MKLIFEKCFPKGLLHFTFTRSSILQPGINDLNNFINICDDTLHDRRRLICF